MIERIDKNLCDYCQICFRICPTDVFRLVPERREIRIAYPEDCQTCFACEIDCPQDAIRVAPARTPRVGPW